MWHDYTDAETKSRLARDAEDRYWAHLDAAESFGAYVEAMANEYGNAAVDEDSIALADGWDRDPDERAYFKRPAA